MNNDTFIDEYPIIDRTKDTRSEITVGDGGYVLNNPDDENGNIEDILYREFVEKCKGYLGSHPSPFMFWLYGAEKHRRHAELLKAFGLMKEHMDTRFELDLDENGHKCAFTVVDDGAGAYLSFEDFYEEIKKPAEPVYDISWIRKRMKCCKNPMERKQLEKQLNAAYKARKKARHKND